MADRFGPLAERYSSFAPAVKRQGGTHPVAIEELSHGMPADRVVTVVGGGSSEPPAIDDRLLAAGEPHRAALDREGTRLHDGPVLVLDRVAGGRVVVAPSSYFAMLATCDALRAEYLTAVPSRSAPGSTVTLPLRDLADAAADPGAGPLRSGRGRAAAIGLSVITTVPTPTGTSFFVGRRRPDLAADPGLSHVAPSGMLEPVPSGAPADPLVAAAGQELGEELGVQLPGGHAALAPRLRVLGVAYDLLRLRPEVCLRLDLTAAEGERRRSRGAPPSSTGWTSSRSLAPGCGASGRSDRRGR